MHRMNIKVIILQASTQCCFKLRVERHTLLKVYKQTVRLLYIFCPISIKLGALYVCTSYFSDCEVEAMKAVHIPSTEASVQCTDFNY